jgi:hypothetical protein
VRIALPDARVEASVREDVHRRGVLDETHRVREGQDQDEFADPQIEHGQR